MSSQILKSPLPYLALIIAHIIWGLNYSIAKVALTEFPVMSLAFLRFFLAFILLIPFVISASSSEKKSHHKRSFLGLGFKGKDMPRLLLAAVFMVTLNIAFFYEGLKRTYSIDASVLSLITPLLSVLAGWWFLKEKVYMANIFGVILGFVGSLAIIGLPLFFTGNLSVQTLFGNLLIILSCVVATWGMLLSKELLATYSALKITFFVFFVGAVTFAVPALVDYLQNPGWIHQVTIIGLLGFLFITILSSICAYILLEWALSKIELYKANLVQYIEPAVTASIAVPLLGERISFTFIIGFSLIILGVYWGTLGKAHHHHLIHKHHRS
jgi:drug/metabolite transporter (DMT)-like permease